MSQWSAKQVLPAIALMTMVGCAGQTAVQNSPADTATATQVAQIVDNAKKNNDVAVMVYDGAWNQGKLELLEQYVSPDVLDHSPLSTEKGTEGFKRIVGSFRSAMPGLKMTIEDEVYSNDRVVHRWTVQGKHTGTPLFGVPASGKEIKLSGISILRMENGKIAERWTNLDQFGMLTQLGVIPPPKSAPAAK